MGFWEGIFAWYGITGIEPWNYTFAEYRVLCLSKMHYDWQHTSAVISTISAIGGKKIDTEAINPVPNPLSPQITVEADILDTLQHVLDTAGIHAARS